MTMLTITHTSAEGTLIDGTAKGDGSADALKSNGWRWSRSLGSWYVPRSRDTAPNRRKIIATADALTDAGFTVAVTIDATPRDGADVEATRVARSEERAAALEAKAQRHARASDDAHEGVERIASGIPLGQPILVGHHSQRRAERDQQRMHRGMDKAITEADAARESERRAKIARAARSQRNHFVTVGNRIAKLEADLRRIDRAIGERTREQAPRHHETRDFLAADLDYWRSVYAQQLEDGLRPDVGPHNVAVGDRVQVHSWWATVTRVSAKSVTVQAAHVAWTSRYAWHELRDHRAK